MSNYAKLKTNLKLAIQRLKLAEKKKTELSHKSRKEIADYISINKPDRARIRVEHIIREDNYVEAMELLEMFCDLLLARFGLIEKMKELDPGLDEAIATIIWSAPRVSNDIVEFKILGDILSSKYGKNYAEACKMDKTKNVNEKVKKRLGVEPPSKVLVEQYLIEIAKNFNVPYTPDPTVMLGQPPDIGDLINLSNASGGLGGFSQGGPGNFSQGGPGGFNQGGGGFIGFDPMAHSKSGDPKFGDGGLSNSNPNIIGANNQQMPVIPPPLPSTFPDEENVDLPGYRQSLPPAYDNNKNNDFFDHSDPNVKRGITGPIVVSDPNAPLPHKPGMYDSPSAPPGYQEKNPYNQQRYVQPSAPSPSIRNQKPGPNLDDLPTVPDSAPTEKKNHDDEDDDVSFDDLQKRFNNLKNN